MYSFLLVIHVIASLFLIFIILLQSGKGEGLSDVFGGGSSQSTIFGTRTATFLTKATTASAIIFMVTCLSLAIISRKRGGSVVQKELFKQEVTKTMKEALGDKDKAAAESKVSVEQVAKEGVDEKTSSEE